MFAAQRNRTLHEWSGERVTGNSLEPTPIAGSRSQPPASWWARHTELQLTTDARLFPGRGLTAWRLVRSTRERHLAALGQGQESQGRIAPIAQDFPRLSAAILV